MYGGEVTCFTQLSSRNFVNSKAENEVALSDTKRSGNPFLQKFIRRAWIVSFALTVRTLSTSINLEKESTTMRQVWFS